MDEGTLVEELRNHGELLNGPMGRRLRRAAAEIDRLTAELATARRERDTGGVCGVCCGQPLPSGKPCVCGGRGTLAAENEGLREELWAAWGRDEARAALRMRIMKLESALRRYGKHDKACNLAGVAMPCTCGLDALLSPAVAGARADVGEATERVEEGT